MRIVPTWSGSPAAKQCLFFIGGIGPNSLSCLSLSITTGGLLELQYTNKFGALIVSDTSASFSATNGTATDIQLSWDGTSGTGKMVLSQNGAILSSINVPATHGIADGKFDYLQVSSVQIFTSVATLRCSYYLNEFIIADYALPTTYAVRTDYFAVAAFDGLAATDPGIANVLSPTAYTIAGVAKVGTLEIPVSTDPGVANVLEGVDYQFEDAARVGELIIPNSTDPGVANVLAGVAYQFEDASKLGTLEIPVSTDPGVENVLEGVDYMIDDVALTGELEGVAGPTAEALAELRSFLNGILGVIETSSITDEEFEEVDQTLEPEYSAEIYAELLEVLDSREALSTTRARLTAYFTAKGTTVSETSAGTSAIFLGAGLED